jgi:hypothetical protein
MFDKREDNGLAKPIVTVGILLGLYFLWRGKGWEGWSIKPSEGGYYSQGVGPVCEFRLDAAGIHSAGQAIGGVDKALEVCRQAHAVRARVKWTGDAIYGVREHLVQALLTAGFMVESGPVKP